MEDETSQPTPAEAVNPATPEANQVPMLQELLNDLAMISHRQATRRRIVEALSGGLRIPLDSLQEDDRTQAIWLVRSGAAEIDRSEDGQSVLAQRKSAFRAFDRLLAGNAA